MTDGLSSLKTATYTLQLTVRAERGASFVSMPIVQPGARVLWCLRRRLSDVRCVLYPDGPPIEVQVFQDRDVVLREMFPEERLALRWAQAYGERLRQQGWHEAAARADA